MPEVHLARTVYLRPDGRSIVYYDPVAAGEAAPARAVEELWAPETLERGPEMRYNPLLDDYTVCAGFRMDRPQLPPKDSCPLCVGGYEAPEPYSVMVFDNRFPSLVLDPAPGLAGVAPVTEVRPGVGKCEVVCYTPKHDSTLGEMPVDHVHYLVYAWCDRYAELSAMPEIQAVMIFENRGEEVGVTLHHPHGQIYAFGLVPPRLLAEQRNAARAAQAGRCIFCEVVAGELASRQRVLWETERFLVVVPFFARLPYELHVYARRHGCSSLLDFGSQDCAELAGILRGVCSTYDALFGQPMPYMMVFHQLHADAPSYHFHVEFYPLRRSAGKLKYAASVETGAGLWLNDAYPEQTIAELRGVAPTEPTMPTATVGGVRRCDL